MTKVVEGGDVDFSGTEARPDSIDDLVNQNPTHMDQLNVAQYVSTTYASFTPPLGQRTHILSKPTSHSLDDITAILPYTIRLTKETDSVTRVTIEAAPALEWRKMLENRYGEELCLTGIYEVTGLDKDDDIHPKDLVHYFPELQPLVDVDASSIAITDNPYQTILTLPVQQREFFTGATNRYTSGDPSNISTDFARPLTRKQIKQYAKEHGDVTKLNEYVAAYKGVPQKPSKLKRLVGRVAFELVMAGSFLSGLSREERNGYVIERDTYVRRKIETLDDNTRYDNGEKKW